MSLKEGTYKSKSFVVPNNKNNQSFVLDDDNIDTSTIEVKIQRSIADTTGILDVWNNATSIVDVGSSTKAYFVEETYDGFPSILFGDDIIGQKLSAGNLVTVTYLTTRGGPDANGVGSTDTANNRAFRFNSATTVVVKNQALVERCENPQIFATTHLVYSSQNRAVTQDDFESLVRSNFSGFDAVYTYGGEASTPPQFGRVFVAFEPADGTVITSGLKMKLKLLKKRTSVALNQSL